MDRQFFVSPELRRWLHRNPSRATSLQPDAILGTLSTTTETTSYAFTLLVYKLEVHRDDPLAYYWLGDESLAGWEWTPQLSTTEENGVDYGGDDAGVGRSSIDSQGRIYFVNDGNVNVYIRLDPPYTRWFTMTGNTSTSANYAQDFIDSNDILTVLGGSSTGAQQYDPDQDVGYLQNYIDNGGTDTNPPWIRSWPTEGYDEAGGYTPYWLNGGWLFSSWELNYLTVPVRDYSLNRTWVMTAGGLGFGYYSIQNFFGYYDDDNPDEWTLVADPPAIYDYFGYGAFWMSRRWFSNCMLSDGFYMCGGTDSSPDGILFPIGDNKLFHYTPGPARGVALADVQTITVTGSPSSGGYYLSYMNSLYTIGPINVGDNEAAVQAAYDAAFSGAYLGEPGVTISGDWELHTATWLDETTWLSFAHAGNDFDVGSVTVEKTVFGGSASFPSVNTWEELTPMPIVDYGVSLGIMVTIASDSFLYIGGITDTGDDSGPFEHSHIVYRYGASGATPLGWERLADLPEGWHTNSTYGLTGGNPGQYAPFALAQRGYVIDELVYVVVYSDDELQTAIAIYDINTDDWEISPPSTVQHHAGGFVKVDDEFWLICGGDPANPFTLTTVAESLSTTPGVLTKITYFNDPSTITGNIYNDGDKARRFDGIDQYAQLDNLTVSVNCTIEGIFAMTDPTYPLLRDSSSGTDGWAFGYDSGGYFAFRIAGTEYVTTVLTSALTTWHHLVLTKEGPDVAFWVDGTRVYTGGATPVPAPDTPSTAPWFIAQDGLDGNYTAMDIDDLAFYAEKVDDERIGLHYMAYAGIQVAA